MRFKVIKALPYRTRQLLADDSYVAGRRSRPQMLPGEIVEVDVRRGKPSVEIRVLVKSKKLEEVRAPANVPPPPPAVAAKIAAAVAPVPVAPRIDPAPATVAAVGAMTTAQMPNAPPSARDDRVALRAEYEKILGKAPVPGWSVDVLREKIAAAKSE